MKDKDKEVKPTCKKCEKEFSAEELDEKGLCSECGEDHKEGDEKKTYSAADKIAEKERKRQLDALILKKKRKNGIAESRILGFDAFVNEQKKEEESEG
jgi:hypothetical protein